MSKFKFGNSIVKIEIEDLIFRIEITQQLREKMTASSQKIREVRAGINELSEREKEEKIIPVFDNAIDEILGAGSSKKIFADREPDAYERIAVYLFVCDEINKQCYEIKAKANEGTV
jgi:regulator of protease activity HflC (stomatin/prohibitin superfamily)